MESQEVSTIVESAAPVVVHEEARPEHWLSLDQIKDRRDRLQTIMASLMKRDIHYGVIPGTNRNSLYQPGGQLLSSTFLLSPSYEIEREDLGGDHRGYTARCYLKHIPTGHMVAEGVGSCSTKESKYRYRTGERVCPSCEQPTIMRSRPEYGGGWYCHQGKGGCGAKFKTGAAEIEGQATGKVENADIADQWNTVLKMAKKRSFLDATITALAAGDIFLPAEQDPEDAAEPERPVRTTTTPPAKSGTPTSSTATVSGTDLKISEPQRKRLFAICKEAKIQPGDLKAYLEIKYQIEHSADIPRAQYERICNEITSGVVASWLLEPAEGEGA